LRRAQPRWIPGVLLGLAGAIISVGLAVVIGVLGANGLAALHAGWGGAPAQSGLYVAAMAALVLTVATIVYATLRRWFGAPELHAGGAVCFAILAWITSFAAPAVSFLFVWPALLMLVALASQRFGERVGEAARWTGTAVTIAILLPIVYQMVGVALGLDATGAAIVATLTALTAWLLAHVLELVGRPWRTTAAFAGAAAILFAIGLLSVRTDADTPVGSTVGYGVDADSNVAYLGARALTPGASRALLRGIGDGPRLRPPSWFARAFPTATPAPPPGTAIRTARVTVLSDSTRGDSSWVRLRITPAAGTRAVSLRGDSSVVWSAQIDGRPVVTDRYRTPPRGRFSIEYVAPHADGFELVLGTSAGRPVALAMVSYHPGIPRVPGLELPVRPAGVIPIQRGDYTLVHQRVRVR
jgi:hypothetical protein